jgi:hypothetical protein
MRKAPKKKADCAISPNPARLSTARSLHRIGPLDNSHDQQGDRDRNHKHGERGLPPLTDHVNHRSRMCKYRCQPFS